MYPWSVGLEAAQRAGERSLGKMAALMNGAAQLGVMPRYIARTAEQFELEDMDRWGVGIGGGSADWCGMGTGGHLNTLSDDMQGPKFRRGGLGLLFLSSSWQLANHFHLVCVLRITTCQG